VAGENEPKPKAGPPPKEASDFFKKKGLRPAFSYRDVWAQEHALAFTVAKLMEIDLLGKVQDSIQKAIDDGTTLETFKKNVKPTMDESGWTSYVKPETKPSRLRLIYETNMRTARASGQADRVQRTKESLPYLKYELGPSKVHREEHAAWEGLILPVDDPFWEEHYPPNGYRCKCRVRQITKYEADKSGGPDTAPEEERVEWQMPDGSTTTAPAGVHPTFAYPMGTAGREKALDDSLKAATKGEDPPKPVDPEKTRTSPHDITLALSDGARRVLCEFVELCPGELDTTGSTKFQDADGKTVRKHLAGELARNGLVRKRETQERLAIYPTELARQVYAIVKGLR
jgi:SPP1 gp7 family putative phage head morphogenesis protein